MAQERAHFPLQVWAGPGSSCCLSASPVTTACPLLVPSCFIRLGRAGSQGQLGGHLAAGRQHPSAARGNPLPPARANLSSPLPAELQRLWGAARGRFMPKKPTAGMADPCHTAQTLFPFYLGKHETAEPRGRVAPGQQLQQCPAPSRIPWDGKLTDTQHCLLLLTGPLEAHPTEIPLKSHPSMVLPPTPHVVIQQHTDRG